MALSPIITFCTKNNCKTLSFEDITGSYSATNTGGWGAPNITLASVDTATIDVTIPDTDEETLTVTSTVTSATIVDGEFSLGDFTMEDFGGEEGDKFPDGIYDITYTITESGIDYTYTIKCFLTCQVDCCVEKIKALFKKWDCNSCDFEKNMMLYFKAKMMLQSAKYAFGCTDYDEAEDQLEAVEKICNIFNCNC